MISSYNETNYNRIHRSRMTAGSSAMEDALALAFANRRFLMIPTVTSLASAGLAIAYAMLLSAAGLPTSTPALLAVLLASTLSSIAGFAFSAICGVMLLHVMTDPVQVVEIMMVCSIAIQSLSIAVLWRDIEWRQLLVFLAGGAVGLPFGVGLLLHLGHVGFKDAIGALLIFYAAYVLLKRPLTIEWGCVADLCVGFLGGMGGADDLVRHKGWDKRRQRGIYQPLHPDHADIGTGIDPAHASIRRSGPRLGFRIPGLRPDRSPRDMVRPDDLRAYLRQNLHQHRQFASSRLRSWFAPLNDAAGLYALRHQHQIIAMDHLVAATPAENSFNLIRPVPGDPRGILAGISRQAAR